jgi:hypothetical protein
LRQLVKDFDPVAKEANVGMSIRCEPVLVVGNATRLRNGFFQVLERLLRDCPNGGRVRVVAVQKEQGEAEIRFRVCGPPGSGPAPPGTTLNRADIALRIAERTFQAAGGAMSIWQRPSGTIGGTVTLRLAGSPDPLGASSRAGMPGTVRFVS